MKQPKQNSGTVASDKKRPKRQNARKFGEWTIPDAAAHLDDVIRKTKQGPQILSDETGSPAFVVVSIADWQAVSK